MAFLSRKGIYVPKDISVVGFDGSISALRSIPKLTTVDQNNTVRAKMAIDLLTKIPGVICSKPKGAFYCVAELPVDDTEVFAQWMLESFQDNNETVMVAPAGGFYSNPELGKKQVRIAYVLNEDDLRRSVELLEKAIAAYRETRGI